MFSVFSLRVCFFDAGELFFWLLAAAVVPFLVEERCWMLDCKLDAGPVTLFAVVAAVFLDEKNLYVFAGADLVVAALKWSALNKTVLTSNWGFFLGDRSDLWEKNLRVVLPSIAADDDDDDDGMIPNDGR